MARLAASVALRIASGTSRALPWPKPTRPRWSPTTTSAAKPNRRPPFTTLATRLICTSLSTNSLSRSSFLRSRGSRAMMTCHPSRTFSEHSKIQSTFSRSLGERLYPAVVEIGAAIEHDVRDALLLRPFGDQLAHGFGCVELGPAFQRFARGFLDRRGRRQRDAAIIVDHLRVNMLRRAVYGEPFAVSRGTAQQAAHTALTPLDPVTELAHQAAPLFLLAFFAEDALAGIFDALALVGLRGPVLANLGSDLADLM